MIGKFFVSFLFLVYSLSSLSYIIYKESKIQAFILGIIWVIGNYYFFVLYSEIFYLEDPEEISRFWFKFIKLVVNSDYHYHMITLYLMYVAKSIRETDESIMLVRLQIIYFFLEIYDKARALQLYWIFAEVIIITYFLFNACSEKIRALQHILFSSIIGAICYTFYGSFASMWPFLYEYVSAGIEITLASYLYFYLQIILHSLIIYIYSEITLTSRYAKTWASENNLCIIFALPFTCFFAFVYDTFIEYMAGSYLDVLKIQRDFIYIFPFALLLSVHHCPKDIKSLVLNTFALYLEINTISYLVFS